MPTSMPYFIREPNTCSYPLHPSANYRGAGWHRLRHRLPPTQPVVILPSWKTFAPGEWFWCARCTRRNAERITHTKSMAVKALTLEELERIHTPRGVAMLRQALQAWGRQSKATLGGRFASYKAQTGYARRHAPPGMEWCSVGLHYSPVEDMASARSYRQHGYCAACYRRYVRGMSMRRLLRWQATQAQARQALQALDQERAALRREIADLRRLREALVQETVVTPRQPQRQTVPAVSAYAIMSTESMVDGDEQAPEAQTPRRTSPTSRRKAYSV